MNGILFVDKNEDWTSHDAVAKARRVLGIKKVGHAGTLDPMATGLLTLGVGPSTRLLTHMVGLDKTYTATIRLGETTHSDDRTGDLVSTANPDTVYQLTPERIAAHVATLTGDIEQVPSQVSAIKVAGKRSYDRVRDGDTVELKSRSVTVHSFTVLASALAIGVGGGPVYDVQVRVHCQSGTYIRALARDLGTLLDVGGHLTELRRTAVGPFTLQDHVAPTTHATTHSRNTQPDPVQAVTSAALALTAPPPLTPPATIARALFPILTLTTEEARDLGHGKQVRTTHPDSELVAAILPSTHERPDELIGLVRVREGRTRVITNFPTPDTRSPAA